MKREEFCLKYKSLLKIFQPTQAALKEHIFQSPKWYQTLHRFYDNRDPCFWVKTWFLVTILEHAMLI